MIVDDSESIRELISFSLESYGYTVIKGNNGVDGLDKIKKHTQIDLIITDLNMPLMDGLTFLQEVRKVNRHQYTPILILTTESSLELRNKAKQYGATGWIIKPFDRDKLINVIQKVIR
ncbi:MAG: response regulator [Vicingaceae bacterium]|nr:response regulator [Vicingaceae bacterium]